MNSVYRWIANRKNVDSITRIDVTCRSSERIIVELHVIGTSSNPHYWMSWRSTLPGDLAMDTFWLKLFSGQSIRILFSYLLRTNNEWKAKLTCGTPFTGQSRSNERISLFKHNTNIHMFDNNHTFGTNKIQLKISKIIILMKYLRTKVLR